MDVFRALTRTACTIGTVAVVGGGIAAQTGAPPPPSPPPPPVQEPVGATVTTIEVDGGGEISLGTRSGWDATSIPDESATGPISGRVIDGVSGRPVPGALVRVRISAVDPSAVVIRQGQLVEQRALMVQLGSGASVRSALPSLGASSGPAALTDSAGRFVIARAMDGPAFIEATRPGYLPGAWGRTWTEGPARTVVLEPGQPVADLTISIWPSAVISGTVLDEAGEPMVEAQVRALGVGYVNGRRQLRLAEEPVLSDDRGMYRLFNLPPGDYVVVAVSSANGADPPGVMSAQRLVQSGDRSDVTVQVGGPGPLWLTASPTPTELPVYYPSTGSPERATVLHVEPGEERAGVDMVLAARPGVSVSGFILGPDGPLEGVSLRLVPQGLDALTSDIGFGVATATMTETGRFTFPAVPAGGYLLRAARGAARGGYQLRTPDGRVVVRTFSVAQAGPDSPPMLTADVPLVVGDDPIDGLVVSLTEGASISGRVQSDTPDSPIGAGQSFSLQLVPLDGLPLAPGFGPTRLNRDGSFSTPAYPPGRYMLDVTPPAGWYLASAVANGRDFSRGVLDLGSDDVRDLVITLSRRTGSVSGVARMMTGDAAEHTSVVLFPLDYQTWIANGMASHHSRVGLTGTDGTFELTGVPPGEYLLAAVPPTTAADTGNPEFIGSLAGSARRVAVGAGATVTVALTTLPVTEER